MKGINPTKALGPDGVHAMFYQKFWDIVGEDTTNLCLDFLNKGKSLEGINKTNIALIP